MIWLALTLVWLAALGLTLALARMAAPRTDKERREADEEQMRALCRDPVMPGWEEHA